MAGEVGVDYCVGHTSVCNRPFHREVNGVDYYLPIFGSRVIDYFTENCLPTQVRVIDHCTEKLTM